MIIDPLPSIYFPPILCGINQRDNSPGGGSIPFRCSWVNYTPAVTATESANEETSNENEISANENIEEEE